jgi:hypothetical protein
LTTAFVTRWTPFHEPKGWVCSRQHYDGMAPSSSVVQREVAKKRGVVWYWKTEEQAAQECARLNRPVGARR